MSHTPIGELPSRYLPQRGVRCPEEIIRAARDRNDIDVDIVWDCAPPFEPLADRLILSGAAQKGEAPDWPGGEPIACWLVLERCEDSERWARVNGQLCRGYRAAFHHRDRKTMASLDPRDIPEAIAGKDQGRYWKGDEEDYIDRATRASEFRQDNNQSTEIAAKIAAAGEKAADRWKTLVRTPDLLRKNARHAEHQAARERDKSSRARFGVSV